MSNTRDIGLFKIISEKSLSAGVRRIQALTSLGCYKYLLDSNDSLRKVLNVLKCSKKEVVDAVVSLKSQNESLLSENKKMKLDNQGDVVSKLVEKSITHNDVCMIFEFLDESVDINVLSDQFKSKIKKKGIMAVGFIDNNQPFLACSITEDLTSKYDAVSIVRAGAKLIKGGGGGRKNFAKAGGKDPTTSPIPPTFIIGAHSAAANRTRI